MDFASYWQYSDAITKGLFFILLLLSLLSWVTGVVRVLHSRKLSRSVSADLRQHIQTKLPEVKTSSESTRRVVIEQALLQNIGRYRYASERGLPILGTTAAIAPFIGLFGTVWGIFHALHNIGTTGQAGLAQVAAPVGEALIMTGFGIAVAIPAVVFYNVTVRINRRVMHHANDTAHDLLARAMTDGTAGANQTVKAPAHVQTDAHSAAYSTSANARS
ncbi:MotA/TolQ/ExbB proton channel family protein [Psychrobacter aestuarii]|uniref:Biopolymer transport protein ExbB n=1 Tax=Psychrobacter aestuarii TaxID=556327 RepID=A0ABP3FBL1_9GAMM|nr:MotA/TolQ/ExbB proton channel family protein [Psychrobacter aestuarii]